MFANLSLTLGDEVEESLIEEIQELRIRVTAAQALIKKGSGSSRP